MKLIIDIPEEDRKDIGNIHFVREDLKFKIGKAIMNGTPLDDVKAEIDRQEFTHHNGLTHWYMTPSEVKSVVFEIIDKHIGKAESEDK